MQCVTMNRLAAQVILLVTLQSTVALVPTVARGDAPEWGNLTGRFLYDGKAPPAKKTPLTKDAKYLKDNIFDESLIVHPQNGGIANVLVYLVKTKSDKLNVHPSYNESPDAELGITVKNATYEPHIQLLRTNQTLVVTNQDSIGHTFHFMFKRNPPFPAAISPVGLKIQCSNEETAPAPYSCGVHPWMVAYILVRATPYMAKTDKNGRFTIENLPVGDHVFQLWHERKGKLRNIRVGTRTTDEQGQLSITIQEGENRLPNTKLQLAERKRSRPTD